MGILESVRIKRKIRRLCKKMRATMTENDMNKSVQMIKKCLVILPENRKEGLLDACLKVLKNGCGIL